jgi:hypothetical protein
MLKKISFIIAGLLAAGKFAYSQLKGLSGPVQRYFKRVLKAGFSQPSR